MSHDDAPPDLPTGDPRVEWLTVAGESDRWRSLGLSVTADGEIALVGTSIRLVPPADDPDRLGIVGWALSGRGESGASIDVDGLSTEVVPTATPRYAPHPVGASGLDHVVVLTPDLERTSAAIAEATGCELKRVREVGSMRQGFHRIGRGGLIVELVERPDLPAGPASFWGLVLIVDDLDAACALLGPDRVSPPKDAVQPGRRIATIRADVGLGLPLALMSH
jgi:catechol 2,3-dioxygenase-like lactoylglutathione lyase family enzyme